MNFIKLSSDKGKLYESIGRKTKGSKCQKAYDSQFPKRRFFCGLEDETDGFSNFAAGWDVVIEFNGLNLLIRR